MESDDLLQRVSDLERRVDLLEASRQRAASVPLARICPICCSEMRVVREKPHDDFAFAGLKVHEMACTKCDHKTERNFNPSKGYE
jgi:hypothetical protein